MEYVEKLSGDREYRQLLERLKELEKDRIYCHHGIGHLLDVARIAYIENLETAWFRKRRYLHSGAAA